MVLAVQAGTTLLVEDWPLCEVLGLQEVLESPDVVGLLEVVEVVVLLQAAKVVELLQSQGVRSLL